MKLEILAILEDVLGFAFETVNKDIFAVHERIGALMELEVLDLDAFYIPKCLVSVIDRDILQRQIIHLPEEFRPVNDTVLHGHIVAIPNGRAGTDSKVTIGDQTAVHMPPRVLAIKTAIISFHIAAALDSRLSINYLDVLKTHIVNAEKGPLPSELFIFNYLHNSFHIMQM